MKKFVRSTLSLLLLTGVLMSLFLSAQAEEVTPRHIGLFSVTGSLYISSDGKATCKGSARLKSGYTADLTMELARDGDPIKTWTTSGSGTIKLDKTYYVTSGHEYTLTATATVYDSSGNVVETPSDTSSKSY